MELKYQDKIGIIALAGICDKEKLNNAKSYFESMGFKVEFSKNIFDENLYLAGNDDIKIDELHRFFIDSSIKLILNARGGYGSIRLLNKIDYNIIKSNPKPFCGYSDITALLLMFYKNASIETYHSPMACSGFTDSNCEYNYNYFQTALSGKEYVIKGSKIYKNGQAGGILWGGNLSTVVSLCGLNFIPDKDFIFFTEDLNEPVYKIDKMFQQLFNIEEFSKHCKGIVLGDFLNTGNEDWLEKYLVELSQTYLISMTGGFNITHSEKKVTIPIGRKAVLEGTNLVIESF